MSLGKKKIQMGSAAEPIVNTENFGIELYNHSSSSTVTFDFAPDLFWIKSRGGSYNHLLFDSVRGIDQPNDYYIQSDTTNAEVTTTNRFSLSNGGKTMTIPSGSNVINSSAGSPYVVWGWKAGGSAVSNTDGDITSQVSANQAAGFSIVKWTADGNGVSSSIGHGLSSAPEIIFTKDTDSSNDWIVNSSLFSNPARDFLKLNLFNAKAFNSADTYDLSTSTFKVGARNGTSGKVIISYLFHSVDGYQRVGTYSGSSSTVTVTTGFEPRFVIIKRYNSGSYDWIQFDQERSGGTDMDDYFAPNSSLNEIQNSAIDITATSTGFTVESGNWAGINASGGEYIYLAIA